MQLSGDSFANATKQRESLHKNRETGSKSSLGKNLHRVSPPVKKPHSLPTKPSVIETLQEELTSVSHSNSTMLNETSISYDSIATKISEPRRGIPKGHSDYVGGELICLTKEDNRNSKLLSSTLLSTMLPGNARKPQTSEGNMISKGNNSERRTSSSFHQNGDSTSAVTASSTVPPLDTLKPLPGDRKSSVSNSTSSLQHDNTNVNDLGLTKSFQTTDLSTGQINNKSDILTPAKDMPATQEVTKDFADTRTLNVPPVAPTLKHNISNTPIPLSGFNEKSPEKTVGSTTNKELISHHTSRNTSPLLMKTNQDKSNSIHEHSSARAASQISFTPANAKTEVSKQKLSPTSKPRTNQVKSEDPIGATSETHNEKEQNKHALLRHISIPTTSKFKEPERKPNSNSTNKHPSENENTRIISQSPPAKSITENVNSTTAKSTLMERALNLGRLTNKLFPNKDSSTPKEITSVSTAFTPIYVQSPSQTPNIKPEISFPVDPSNENAKAQLNGMTNEPTLKSPSKDPNVLVSKENLISPRKKLSPPLKRKSPDDSPEIHEIYEIDSDEDSELSFKVHKIHEEHNQVKKRRRTKPEISHPLLETLDLPAQVQWLMDEYKLPKSEVLNALKSASFDVITSQLILHSISEGKGVPNLKNIWTADEDEILLNSSSIQQLERLKRKHESSNCRRRLKFLRLFEK